MFENKLIVINSNATITYLEVHKLHSEATTIYSVLHRIHQKRPRFIFSTQLVSGGKSITF